MGLIALITIAYGIVQPLNLPHWVRHSLLGIAFGAGACACMINPIEIGPGILLDSRNLFLGFAGAFLGPLGAGVALAIAGAVRIAIGGNGMLIGLSSMFVAMSIGVLWGVWREREKGLKPEQLAMMGLSLSLTLLIGLSFLKGTARENLSHLVPFFVCINLCGTLFFGALLERERNNARRVRSLLNQAFHDPLTGALNRRGLEVLYGQTMTSRGNSGRGIILMDLDNFKKINDTHGHSAGDETLIAATQAIKDVIRSEDLVARVGGEEFIVLFPNISERDFLMLSERIRMSVKRNHDIDYLNVTVSIGGTFWETENRSLEDAMQKADTLMYRAKKQGRDRMISDLPLAA
jgi:diguanylate cyclase